MSSQATSQDIAQDNRVALETTGGGQFAGPGSVVANPYGIATSIGPVGSRSRVETNTNFSGASFGLDGDQVKALLDQAAAAGKAQSEQATQLASGAIQSLAASKGSEPINISRYIPYIIAGVVLVAIFSRRRRGGSA